MEQSIARDRFFDKQVHMQIWKDTMSGNIEEIVMRHLDFFGYKFGIDFVRQHPIGNRFVIDFSFPKEKVAIEVDGNSPSRKAQTQTSRLRENRLSDFRSD